MRVPNYHATDPPQIERLNPALTEAIRETRCGGTASHHDNIRPRLDHRLLDYVNDGVRFSMRAPDLSNLPSSQSHRPERAHQRRFGNYYRALATPQRVRQFRVFIGLNPRTVVGSRDVRRPILLPWVQVALELQPMLAQALVFGSGMIP